ncbi:aldo/keto reductase [Paenibacillus radicis (ex Xue et al. 2023)]|uniref:Aldo/keto reductase n=1 Tax=Paenibacillus radicis (ex Xue et al. 2023) TaxID=2972489 RepID=A0ABT1YEK5_9BACL|nr:aldo/keto reductase [Paenibacillus radicis (ex Xue et al. 2023)]MCR8631190.1 aldo/keto reductase [Paenibacillus radicis (ex Xue et al. 2023)]
MDYRFVGKTGLKVSELCLGSMTFGAAADREESFRIMDRYTEAGGNFIDTANVYSQGLSEEIVGAWLKEKNRNDFVVATKVRFGMGEGPNDMGLSRKHILASVEDSLRRLGTDYIDLFQVHAWDAATPLEETLSTLNDLVRKGVIRYIGASNYRAWQLQKAIYVSRQNGWESFVCLQPQYNLLCRATEYELLPLCEHEGVGVIPWSPLRGGLLSGKFKRGETPQENTRVGANKAVWERYDNEFTWNIIDTLGDIAKETDKSSAQVALNWMLSRSVITSPIIGARNVGQLDDNLGASGWSLTEEQIHRLNDVSELPVSYPYDLAAENQQRRGRVAEAVR